MNKQAAIFYTALIDIASIVQDDESFGRGVAEVTHRVRVRIIAALEEAIREEQALLDAERELAGR